MKAHHIRDGALGLGLAVVLCAAAQSAIAAESALQVTALKTEYRVDPIGIDATGPRFGWQLTATARAQTQRAYQILVASSAANLDADVGDKWDSAKVTSD